MKKYLIKSVSTATKENPNFAGSAVTYWHGKACTLVASEGASYCGWKDLEMNSYFVKESGYDRLCDAKRSWLYKNPENNKNWRTEVEIVAVEV